MKTSGEKIAMLTAYDFGMACLLDESNIDIILVGDSLGNVVLGYDTTLPVTMEDMLHHTQAVARGTRKAMVVADLPFLSYQVSPEAALANAGRFLKEADAQAIKLEGGREYADTVEKLTRAGVPVMAHLGLTPQSIHQLGGYKVQGKKEEAADKMIQDAVIMEEAGAFALVLECVPEKLAAEITRTISIPTIGIGAGVSCDGQVLVVNDMLGLNDRMTPKFVKKYAHLNQEIRSAILRYIEDVKSGAFPDTEHSFK
jgi:3-methyl-2-oxobutanoate hydroxymethyltransferase